MIQYKYLDMGHYSQTEKFSKMLKLPVVWCMSCILKLNLTILHTFQVSHIHAEKSLISHHLMNRTCYLIGVVGAGDQQEDPGEGVLGWIGNLPGLRAWVKVAKKKHKSLYSLLCLQFVTMIFYIDFKCHESQFSQWSSYCGWWSLIIEFS